MPVILECEEALQSLFPLQVQIFRLAVDPRHFRDQDLVGLILDVHHAVIRVLPVEAALLGLIRVLEPVIADQIRLGSAMLT